MTRDPLIAIGADPRTTTLDGVDRMRLEALAARTGAIVEAEPGADGLTVRLIAPTGRTTEASGRTAAEATRALMHAIAHPTDTPDTPDIP